MGLLEAVDLDLADKYRGAIYMHPRFTPASAWREHIPFAFFLTAVVRPSKFVELGSYYGASYFAFCQAIKEFKINCSCYAVDTWAGDKHAGNYGSEVFDFVRVANSHYKDFSYLLKMEFDIAATMDDLNDIDILHIDGLHTYDAVRHDFQTWLPKLSKKAVVLFHDTYEMRDDFGVYKFWDEIKGKYPSFMFKHGHGLGVLMVGEDHNEDLLKLANDPNFNEYEDLFETVGLSI